MPKGTAVQTRSCFALINYSCREKPDVLADHIITRPIPQSQINANPNLLQNDNY